MIVSTAIAVLPVERSPMISSRCPLPIGISASIARMPVGSDCLTACRCTTPGATFSIVRYFLVSIGPLPSIGCPSGLTTRPSSASPTGTEAMRPVRRTVSPSLMSSSSPMSTTPTLSSSKLSATPCRPPFELDQLRRAHAAQTVHAREIRADLDHGADLVLLDAGLEARDLLLEDSGNFVCVDHASYFQREYV